MDKKDFILTIAKDLVCAYKILPENRIMVDKTVDGVADILDQMAKRVKAIYEDLG